MNSSNRKYRLSKLAAVAIAATALAAPAWAAQPPMHVYEGQDPSFLMEPDKPAAPVQAVEAAPSDPTYTYTPAATVGPLTRAEVREALANWRNAGLLMPANDTDDTQEVLAAREAFNAMQAEAITGRWALETERMAKAREVEYAAQLARQEIEAVLAAAALEQPVDTAAVGQGLIVEMPAEASEPVLAESPDAAVAPATPAASQ